MKSSSLNMAPVWHMATDWIDKEIHRWSVCLLVVLALHAGAIAGFEEWKTEADRTTPPPGVMMIDLSPLPGPGGRGADDKPAKKSRYAAAQPLMHADVKKPHHFHRLVRLRPKIEHLLKAEPKAAEHVPPPSAIALPKPQSSTQVALAGGAPTPGAGSSRSGSDAGGTAGPSGGCCGGRDGGGPVGHGQGGAVTWQRLLLAHLEAHKRYPPAAQERGEEGVVYLRFAMDRTGKVLSFSLEKSSGFDDLDQETLGLIQRSQPLPPPPPSITGSVIELVVPVQFQLQQDN